MSDSLRCPDQGATRAASRLPTRWRWTTAVPTFEGLSGGLATTSAFSADSPATHAPVTLVPTRCAGLASLAPPALSPIAVGSRRAHAAIPSRTRTSSSDLRPRMSLQLPEPLAGSASASSAPHLRLAGEAASPARELPHGDTSYASRSIRVSRLP